MSDADLPFSPELQAMAGERWFQAGVEKAREAAAIMEPHRAPGCAVSIRIGNGWRLVRVPGADTPLDDAARRA